MSVPEPTAPRQAEEPIDIDMLISEVKKRPGLYVRPTYMDQETREIRQKQWSEICQALFMAWDDFNVKKKKEKVREVQSKWRRLREIYLKHRCSERLLTASGKKKKKYNYFDNMTFLIPTLVGTADDVNVNNNNDTPLNFSLESIASQGTQNEPSTYLEIPEMPNVEQGWNISQNNETGERDLVPSNTGQQDVRFVKFDVPKAEIVDENTHFALMLAPMMRKLNDEQRYLARCDILRIVRQANWVAQSQDDYYLAAPDSAAAPGQLTDYQAVGGATAELAINYSQIGGTASVLQQDINFSEAAGTATELQQDIDDENLGVGDAGGEIQSDIDYTGVGDQATEPTEMTESPATGDTDNIQSEHNYPAFEGRINILQKELK